MVGLTSNTNSQQNKFSHRLRTKTMDKIQDDIIEEFSLFDEWLDKYNYLIELGGDLPEMNPQHRTDKYLIEGCQSRVWVDAELDEQGVVRYSADSDAIITKGIIALLIRVLNGRTPQQILDTELYFIDKIGLKEHRSPTRSNGLVAMIKTMRLYARAFASRS